MLTLLQLQYFYELAKAENVSRAAAGLGIRQATLSRLISGLEKELGVSLFDRSHNSLHLSEEGKAFFIHVDDILFALKNGQRAALDTVPGSISDITLCAGSPYVWFDLLQRFEQEHPGLHVRNIATPDTSFFGVVQSASVDLVIMGPSSFHEPDYECHKFRENRMYVAVPREHPFAEKTEIYLEELKGESFIRLSTNSRLVSLCDELLNAAGIKAKNIITCDYISRPNLVTAGLGVAITTSRAKAADLLYPNCYIPIADKDAVWQLYLYRNKRRYQSHAAAVFTEYMINELT